jgi:hypothetical protein
MNLDLKVVGCQPNPPAVFTTRNMLVLIFSSSSLVHRTPLIWRPQAPNQGSTVGGLLSVSPPEEHH